MLPRMGRDSLSLPQPSSPSNSSVKSSSTTTKTPSIPNYRRSIGGSNKSNHPNTGGGGGGRPPSTNSSSSSRSTTVTATTTMMNGVNNNQNASLIKHDPRPIQDKGYQQNCIRTLLSFLTKSGYAFPVTLKSLSQPSGKDFVQIVTFLLKKIDPTFGALSSNPAAASELKLEEEVAFHFKALGYPYPVSKTSLVAAGSPHTWPSLLAALAWLVEHICVWNVGQQEDELLYYNVFSNDASQEQHQTFQSLTELEIQTDRVFFAFLHQAYVAFLESNADKCDLWQEKLMDRFEHDNTILEREIERMTDLNATMVEKIHLLQQQSDGYVS
jgi:kinetochore protein NDC80